MIIHVISTTDVQKGVFCTAQLGIKCSNPCHRP